MLALEKFIPAKNAKTILKNLDAFSIDPELVDKILEGSSLSNQGQGTHFYVMPTDPILERDIDEIGSEDVAAPLQKMLLDFQIQ